MNLQINLLLESERRSGSNVSRKFIALVAAAAIPVIILSIIIPLWLALRHAERNLISSAEEKEQLDSVYKVVVDLQEKIEQNSNILNELEGWRQSRLNWYEMFTELQLIVPANLQFTRMMINEKIEQEDGVPARKMLMMVKGKVVGKNAREDIQQFDRSMKKDPVLELIMSGVEIRLLGASESPDEEDVRLFDAICNFKSRKMGEKRRRVIRK